MKNNKITSKVLEIITYALNMYYRNIEFKKLETLFSTVSTHNFKFKV